ncbi:MAG: chemotaxis protein CheB, partial [Mesorhizobium sp.]
MARSTVIAIGASAGGVDALHDLVAKLPEAFPASVLIVLHVGAHRSELPAILNAAGPVPAKHATNYEQISTGQIYVAPPDHHMIVSHG